MLLPTGIEQKMRVPGDSRKRDFFPARHLPSKADEKPKEEQHIANEPCSFLDSLTKTK
jgi:hypothetical protein